jgi:hypothetical protein
MSDISGRMRHHVQSRGGPSKDEDGNPVLPNGAWAMMLEGADALDAKDAELTRLRSLNAELVVALRTAPSPADYKTLDEYIKAFCHWVEWKQSSALIRARGGHG